MTIQGWMFLMASWVIIIYMTVYSIYKTIKSTNTDKGTETSNDGF